MGISELEWQAGKESQATLRILSLRNSGKPLKGAQKKSDMVKFVIQVPLGSI